MLILSFLSVHLGGGKHSLDMENLKGHINSLNSINNSASLSSTELRNQNVRQYILENLSDIMGADKQQTASDSQILNDYADIGLSGPSFIEQKVKVSDETARIAAGDGASIWAGVEIKNVIAIFPANVQTNTSDAVVFNVSYDPNLGIGGAMTANADISVMLENIRQLANSNFEHSNDIVFLFGQNKDANLGLHVFANQFKGYNQLAHRSTLTIGFRGLGADGSLSLYDTSSNNFALLSSIPLSGSNNSSFVSSFIRQSQNATNLLGLNFSYLTFGNTGNMSFSNTNNDNEISVGTLNAKAHLSQNLIRNLSNANISTSNLQSSINAVYFNYLGLNVVLPVVVFFIMGLVLLLLLGGLLFYAVHKKAFSLKSIINGLAVQVLALMGVIAISLICYYVFAFFMFIYKGLPLVSINSFVYYNPGLLIAFMLFSLAASNALYAPLKGLFKTRGVDIVRGNVVLISLLAVLLSFVLPTASYPFVILSLLQLVVMFASVKFKNKFREKYTIDIERLFLYGIPVIATLPLTIPVIISVAKVAPMPVYSILAASVAMLFSFVTPYLSMLNPFFNKLCSKLPKYTVRVESLVEQEVEHSTKKGKFVVEKVRTIEKRPTSFKYRNFAGTFIVAAIAAVIFFTSAAGTIAFGNRIDNGNYNAIFQNGIVLAWEQTNGNSPKLNWEVRDHATFSLFDKVNDVDGFSYNSDLGAFRRREDVSFFGNTPTIQSQGDGVYQIKPAAVTYSQIELVATGVSQVRTFEIVVRDRVVATVQNPNNLDRITINLNNIDTVYSDLLSSFGNLGPGESFEVRLLGAGGSTTEQTANWEYTEYCYESHAIIQYDIWNLLEQYFKENMPGFRLRGGVVYRISQ
jgi:hypothetical protein